MDLSQEAFSDWLAQFPDVHPNDIPEGTDDEIVYQHEAVWNMRHSHEYEFEAGHFVWKQMMKELDKANTPG